MAAELSYYDIKRIIENYFAGEEEFGEWLSKKEENAGPCPLVSVLQDILIRINTRLGISQ